MTAPVLQNKLRKLEKAILLTLVCAFALIFSDFDRELGLLLASAGRGLGRGLSVGFRVNCGLKLYICPALEIKWRSRQQYLN